MQKGNRLPYLYNAFLYYGIALNRTFAANLNFRDGVNLINLMRCVTFQGMIESNTIRYSLDNKQLDRVQMINLMRCVTFQGMI